MVKLKWCVCNLEDEGRINFSVIFFGIPAVLSGNFSCIITRSVKSFSAFCSVLVGYARCDLLEIIKHLSY